MNIVDPPYIIELKQFLLLLPVKSNFELGEKAKILLRKTLCLAVSCGGKHYVSLFPKLATLDPTQTNLINTLENKLQWSFIKYDAEVPTPENHSSSVHQTFSHPRGLPCARVFRRGEPIFKCSTCALDETCALCAYCFHQEQHEGHVVNILVCQRENGGVCDCGDPEAWVHQFNCRDCDNEEMSVVETSDVPEDFHMAFSRTIDILLDFVVDVMCQSDLQFDLPWDLSMNSKRSAASNPLDPQKYGFENTNGADYHNDPPSEKFSLIAYNNQVHHFRDAVQRIQLASKKVPEFAVMVADQIHRHGRARVIQSRNVALLHERQKSLSSTGLISCIRNARDEFRENMCHEILLWIGGLVERDVFKGSEKLKNALCQSFCSRWKSGLPDSSYNNAGFHNAHGPIRGKLDSNFNLPRVEPINRANPGDSKWYYNPARKWQISSELSQQCDYDQSINDYVASSFKGSRFQYMVYLDIRFWKSIRLVLHTIYSTYLITNLKYKAVFCCQFVDIYPGIADMFLALDGEPELNIMCTLSTQLFTCLSNSTTIINRGDASRIFASIFNFLRTGSVIYLEIPAKDQFKISLSSLKNRRWGQILFDIGYILGRGRDKILILSDSTIPMVCDILTLFQGKPVMVREKENHVEYESSDYTAFFQAVLVIYQFAEFVAHSVANLPSKQRKVIALRSISYVVHHLLLIETVHFNTNTSLDHNSTDYGSSLPANQDSLDDVTNRDQLRQSFLHPLHSFLAWLIEYAGFEDSTKLVEALEEVINQFKANHPTSNSDNVKSSLIYQYPLRTIVLSSQIKSGFWVRNGFSVRSQLQLYKSTNLRDQGYLRDLFLVQTFVSITPPDVIMTDLLKIWCFYDWTLSGSIEPLFYEADIFTYMLEECLSTFIHILTEDLFLCGLSSDATAQRKIRYEIIHNLCFGPMTFSKLCTQIPEHIAADKRFETTLEKLATYKKPKSCKDSGSYTLKEKYLEEINPFYFNYTINKKDDAIKFVKERVQATSHKRYHDIVITPKLIKSENLGIYRYIGNFTTSPLFCSFLVLVIRLLKSSGSNRLEGLTETILHLLHICVMEETLDLTNQESFLSRMCEVSNSLGTSLVNALYELLHIESYMNHHAKIRAIFSFFTNSETFDYHILESTIRDFDPKKLVFDSTEPDSESGQDVKKRFAKARQMKLMAKFKKQQSLFLKNHDHQHIGSDTEMTDAESDGWRFPDTHCIVCQDTAKEVGPFGLLSHISKSSEFRKVPFQNQYWFLKAFSDNSNLNTHPDFGTIPEKTSSEWKSFMSRAEEDAIFGPGFTDHNHVEKNVTSVTCGHGMHFLCYLQYLSTCRPRSTQLTRNPPDVVENREFLCPLCKSLNNMFIPVLWSTNNRSLSDFLAPASDGNTLSEFSISSQLHKDSWFETFAALNTASLRKFLLLTTSVVEMLEKNTYSMSIDAKHDFRLLISNMSKLLAMLSFPVDFEVEYPIAFINSIKYAEIALRGQDTHATSVISQLSNNSLINLRVFNEYRLTLMEMKANKWFPQPYDSRDIHLRQLSHIQNLTADFLNETILSSDFFEVLVNAFPVPTANVSFNCILFTCFIGLIIQTGSILTSQIVSNRFFVNDHYTILDVPVSEMVSDHEAQIGVSLFMKLQRTKHNGLSLPNIVKDIRFGYVFYSMLLKSVTPFLRQALIYAYVCCANIDGINLTTSAMVFEADQICQVMKIPTLNSVLTLMVAGELVKTTESTILQNFLVHLGTSKWADDLNAKTTFDYPGQIKLINLPARLDRFFTDYYYLEKFQNPHLTIENPAVCMYCAAVVDVQKGAVDSNFGQCSAHFATECNNSVGIFLLPKERTIVLLHRNGGSFYDAPYLDQHGELTGDNKKGKTAYLLVQRYDDFIRNMWLMHNIPNYVVRKLDSTIDAGGWETL